MVGTWHFLPVQYKKGLSTEVFKFQATDDKMPSLTPWEAVSNWKRPMSRTLSLPSQLKVRSQCEQKERWTRPKEGGA